MRLQSNVKGYVSMFNEQLIPYGFRNRQRTCFAILRPNSLRELHV